MPREHEPFFKWDPDGANARRRQAARHLIDGHTAEEADRLAANTARASNPLAGKKWILRWAWLLSTGMLVLGYLVLVALLTGWGDWLHLTD